MAPHRIWSSHQIPPETDTRANPIREERTKGSEERGSDVQWDPLAREKLMRGLAWQRGKELRDRLPEITVADALEPQSRERKRRGVQHREIGRENGRNREQREKEQHREKGRENRRNIEKGEKMAESNRYEKTVCFSRNR